MFLDVWFTAWRQHFSCQYRKHCMRFTPVYLLLHILLTLHQFSMDFHQYDNLHTQILNHSAYMGHFINNAQGVFVTSLVYAVLNWRLLDLASAGASATETVKDQRSYIKTETLRDKNATKIHNALREVCGEQTVDRSRVSRWATRCREGRVTINDDPRPGRPKTSTDE